MASLVLFAWIPISLIIYCCMPPRRATLASCMVGWLFLPRVEVAVQGLPNIGKVEVINYGLLLGALLFAGERLLAVRPRWFDLPMLVLVLCPGLSSLSNGLGGYDAISTIFTQVGNWGIPYLIGRALFGDADGLRLLAVGFTLAGLAYVPLCVWEIRMSPLLHVQVYRVMSHNVNSRAVAEGLSGGGDLTLGYRPRVFMANHLEVGIFMASTCLAAVWLYRGGLLRRIGPFAAGPMVLILLGTTIMCKATGAVGLMMIGLITSTLARNFRTALPLLALTLAPPMYAALRISGILETSQVERLVHPLPLPERRIHSFLFRLENEDILIAKAMQRPLLGWGGWGRNRVYNEVTGKDMSITDGKWVIQLGNYGFVGLVSLLAATLLPTLLFLQRCPAAWWRAPTVSPAVGLATLLVINMIDDLMNGSAHLPCILVAGALAGVAGSAAVPRRRAAGAAGQRLAAQGRPVPGRPVPWTPGSSRGPRPA